MQSQTFHIGGDGGISIAAEATGNADALPVLLAHGGGQSRHAWKLVTADLANAGFRPIAIDMRGHGDSEWSAEGAYETRDFASDLVAIASKMDRKPALVGASLGGLAGLIAEGHLAPGRFASLTLVDIAPRMETGGVMRVVGFMEEHVETGFSSPDEAAEVKTHILAFAKTSRDFALQHHTDCPVGVGPAVRPYSRLPPTGEFLNEADMEVRGHIRSV